MRFFPHKCLHAMTEISPRAEKAEEVKGQFLFRDLVNHGVFTYIYSQNYPNVGKEYTIHSLSVWE